MKTFSYDRPSAGKPWNRVVLLLATLAVAAALPAAAMPGALDTTFGGGTGMVLTAVGSGTDRAFAVVLQPDGRIVVGGEAFTGTATNFAVVRYNADGTLDTSFNGTGAVTSEYGTGASASIAAVALQPDGKIVAAGTLTIDGGRFSYNFRLVARYTANGAPDTTFNGTGYLSAGPSGSTGTAVAVQPDGKILVAGMEAVGAVVQRFNPDGTPDPTFNGTGTATAYVSYPRGLALSSDGAILVGGSCYSSTTQWDFCATRLLAGGTPDPAFGGGTGNVLLAMAGNENLRGIALAGDGRIAMAGAGDGKFVVARLNADGTTDTSFNGTGMAKTAIGSDAGAQAVAIQPDGRIVVAGFTQWTSKDLAVVRYTAAGTLDTSFNATGIVITPAFDGFASIEGLAIQRDGKVVAAGSAFNGAYYDMVVARYQLAPDAVITQPTVDADFDGVPNGVEWAEGLNFLVKDNDIFSPGNQSARLFAMQMYRDFLGREGDAGGIQGWADAVASGSWSRLTVIDAFLSSPEFAGSMAPVVRLYFATYLRVPDYAGLMHNAGMVRAGTASLQQIADFFAASPEFVATYGALDNTAFVTLLYNNVLGRAPDAGGLAGWVVALDGGMTRGQVLLGFSESPEYQAAMANEVFVTMMYAGMLRRTPEAFGFASWVAQMDAGSVARWQVINGFYASGEYWTRFVP